MATRKVLLADGDETSRTRLAVLLEELAASEGVELAIEHAKDGGEALELARKHQPELVVLEVLLEGPHGLQVMRQLRKDKAAHAPPRVILVTEMSAEIDRYWGLRNGAAAYVKKPWVDEQLREVMAEQLRALG